MKKLLIVLLFSTSIQVYGQEFIEFDSLKMKCYYMYNFQVDSSNINSVKSQEMVLEVGHHSSKFLNINKLYRDSLLMVYKDEPVDVAAGKILPMVMGAPTHSFCNYSIIKDYPVKGQIISTGYLNKKHLKVNEQQNASWELISDRDTILLGFSCNLATTTYAGRKYNAYYTLDVPVSEGPYKFSGLPGLIVSIRDTKNQHSFELYGTENIKRNQKIFYIENNCIEVSPEEYLKAIHLKSTTLYNRIQQGDGLTLNSDETKARALNKLKSRNNYIEKY